jgi:hypothetical protein
MKIYRFSEAGLDALAKQARRRSIIAGIGFIVLTIGGLGIVMLTSPIEEDIVSVLFVLVCLPLLLSPMIIVGSTIGVRRIREQAAKSEIQLDAESITLKTNLTPQGATLHRDDIKSLRETSSGNELLIYSKQGPAYAMSTRFDDYASLKAELEKWLPFDPPPPVFLGGGQTTAIIVAGALVTMLPFIPVWISLPVGLATLGITIYLVIPMLRNPAVSVQHRLGSILMPLIVVAVLLRRVCSDLVIPNLPPR